MIACIIWISVTKMEPEILTFVDSVCVCVFFFLGPCDCNEA